MVNGNRESSVFKTVTLGVPEGILGAKWKQNEWPEACQSESLQLTTSNQEKSDSVQRRPWTLLILEHTVLRAEALIPRGREFGSLDNPFLQSSSHPSDVSTPE